VVDYTCAICCEKCEVGKMSLKAGNFSLRPNMSPSRDKSLTPTQLTETGIGGLGNIKWHPTVKYSTGDWIERQVFPADDNRCQRSRLSCGRNQSQDSYFILCWFCWFNFCTALLQSLLWEFYRQSSVLLCGGKFHFCCGTAVSSICVT
jgi:hypothetical protein